MAISENTLVSLKVGSIVSVVAAIVGLTWQVFEYAQRLKDSESRLAATEHRLTVARNWLFVLKYPNDPWSANYDANHNFLQD